MKKKKLFSGFVLIFIFALSLAGGLFAPSDAQASLVPCGQYDDDLSTPQNDERAICTLCHLVIGTKGLIDWGIGIMFTIAIVVITAMGILYIVSIGNDGMMATAKKGIIGSLVGSAIMLGAWLIVTTVLMVLTGNNTVPGLTRAGTGFSFSCNPVSTSNAVSRTGATTPAPTTSTSPTTPTTTTTGDVCPGVNADTLRTSLTSGGKVCTAGCSKVCTFPANISAAIDQVKASSSLYSGLDTRLVKAIICRENTSLNLTAVGPTGDCGLMQIDPDNYGQTSCTSPRNLFDLQTNLREGMATLVQSFNRVAPTTQQVSIGITKIAMTGAAYNCCANRDNPNSASNDCSTANSWPAGMTKWACPVNPGTGTFNMCAVREYACDIDSCVNRY